MAGSHFFQSAINSYNPPAATLVTTDLMVYYDANNASSYPGSGTDVFDLSGNGYDGTMQNSLPVNTTSGITYWDWGDSNNTRTLDVTWNSALDFSTAGAVTGEAWVYLNSLTTKNGEGHFFNLNLNGSHAYNGYQYVFRYNTTNLESFIGNNTSWGEKFDQDALSGTSITTGAWMQLAFTYSTSDYKARFYHNGSKIYETATAWSAQSMLSVGASPALHIGSGLGTSAQVAARISIARLYDRALSDAELLQNYDYDKATFGL